MKRIFSLFLIACFVTSCAGTGGVRQSGSGTFRGKWWNYYDRGILYSEEGAWESVYQEMNKAISMREKDQRMARTYGMHFIDYFPHRELGIAYLNTGDVDGAIRELELSISQEESAKAVFYLNKARKEHLRGQTGRSFQPPDISVDAPAGDVTVNSLSVRVKARVSGEGFISRVLINNVPHRFERAQERIVLEKDIPVEDGENEIEIYAADLLGNSSRRTVRVNVDRQGPMISVFDITASEEQQGALVRITGEISDRSGIRDVRFNDKTKSGGDTKAYEFDVTTAKGMAGERFTIEATDSIGNRTSADLDIVKELAAFRVRPEPVLLAFAGEKIFSSDGTPPVIELKDAEDLPAIFVDKYYVEGEVSDNSEVEKIVINGKEEETKKGKKVFFSKVVGLAEGENRIAVEASDSAGNMAESGFSVKRNLPSVFKTANRMSISVLPFEEKGSGRSITQLAYEQLIGAFIEQKRFSVIERTKLEQVLLEQKLTKEQLTDPKHSIKVGRIIAAEGILATSIHETPRSIEVISRVINTETSEVMEVRDVFSEDKSFSTVRMLMEGLAAKIAGSFPLVEGMVIESGRDMVYTDIGSSMKVKKGMGAILYRKGKEIKHPATGRSLGFDTVKLAEGAIEEIEEDFSKVRLDDAGGREKIAAKDFVITK